MLLLLLSRFSCVWLFVTPWTVTSTRLLCPWNFPGKNTGVLPFPTPGNLPHPGIKPTPLASPALAGRFFTNSSTCEIHYTSIKKKKKLVGNCLVRVGVTRLAYLRTAAAAAKSLQSCPTVQPHRRQLTRLPRPWDSPGKKTGVGCHFLLQYMKVKSESEVFQSCPTPSDPMDCSLPGSSVHGIFQARVLEWGAIAFSVSQN